MDIVNSQTDHSYTDFMSDRKRQARQATYQEKVNVCVRVCVCEASEWKTQHSQMQIVSELYNLPTTKKHSEMVNTTTLANSLF